MAIVQTIRDQLLQMCGLENVSHGPADLADRIISDIRRAQEHIGDSNPNLFYQARPDQAEVIRAATDVTVTVTQYSKEVIFTSGWADWMAGQAILISGDSTLNRIEDEGITSAPALSQPYMGSSGTVSATVYNDWILLPEDVNQLMDPIMIDRRLLLVQAQSAGDNALRFPDYASRSRYDRYQQRPVLWQKSVGDPTKYWPYSQTVRATVRAGVMLDSLPAGPNKFNYDAKKAIYAPVCSLDDTRTTLVPENKDHEILLPVCRWFFASYQHVNVPKQELEADFLLAVEKASSLSVVGNRRKIFQYSPYR